MFLAMNRFRIALGHEDAFEQMWHARDSHLAGVPGFVRFHLLRGATTDEYTLFASHTEWASAADFEAWTQSDAFRAAHANAGKSAREMYVGPPQLELFQAVI